MTVIATSSVAGRSATSDPSNAANVNAYGPPGIPSVSAQGNANNVTLSWNGNGTSNGRAIDKVQIETDGGTRNVGLTGSVNEGNGRNQGKGIRARVLDSTGVWGPWSGRQRASTWGNRQYSVQKSGTCNHTSSAGCEWVEVRILAFNPGSRGRCSIGGSGGGNTWTKTWTVDGGGNSGWSNTSDGGGRLYDSDGSRIARGTFNLGGGDLSCSQL